MLWPNFTLIAIVAGSLCTVHDTTAYTGIRVFQQYTWSSRGMKRAGYMIVRCQLGTLKYKEVVHVSSLFDQVVCPTKADCFKFARTARHVEHENWVSQSKIVGGVFQRYDVLGEEEYLHEWHALSPLVSDFRSKWLVTRQNHTTIIQQSLVRTPCMLEKSYPRSGKWTQHVDINEVYT